MKDPRAIQSTALDPVLEPMTLAPSKEPARKLRTMASERADNLVLHLSFRGRSSQLMVLSAVMPRIRVTPSMLREGLQLQTGQQHTLVICQTACVRLDGITFDLEKAFVLPSAAGALRQLTALVYKHEPREILVVGHTDDRGSAAFNRSLSLDRAKSMVAFLQEDVDCWMSFYTHEQTACRWGPREDRYMLGSLRGPHGSSYLRPNTSLKDATLAFQRDHGLSDDGILGPDTRRALVSEYLKLDGTTLSPNVTLVTYGCGEDFPREDSSRAGDAEDRRVEFFLFPEGITPPPSNEPGDSAYLAWKDQSKKCYDLRSENPSKFAEVILYDRDMARLADSWYCVVLPDDSRYFDRSDHRGVAHIELVSSSIEMVDLLWGADVPEGPYAYSRTIYLKTEGASTRETLSRKLHNLGHDTIADLQDGVISFQQEHKVDTEAVPTGTVDGLAPKATTEMIHAVFERARMLEEPT